MFRIKIRIRVRIVFWRNTETTIIHNNKWMRSIAVPRGRHTHSGSHCVDIKLSTAMKERLQRGWSEAHCTRHPVMMSSCAALRWTSTWRTARHKLCFAWMTTRHKLCFAWMTARRKLCFAWMTARHKLCFAWMTARHKLCSESFWFAW